MAEVVKAELLRAKAAYPWQEWLDGRVWKLTPQKDFKCTPIGFSAIVYLAAKRANKKVHVSHRNGAVFIQAYNLAERDKVKP